MEGSKLEKPTKCAPKMWDSCVAEIITFVVQNPN
jgi:hypothetical protein